MPSNYLQKRIDAYRARLGRAMRDAAPDSRAIFLNHALNFSGPLIHDILLELQEAERQRDALKEACEMCGEFLEVKFGSGNGRSLSDEWAGQCLQKLETVVYAAKGEPR